MSYTAMGGAELDRVLKQIAEAESAENVNKVLYIRNGKLALDTYDNLFTITELE